MMVNNTLFVVPDAQVERVGRMNDYTLKKELEQALIERQVAELQHSEARLSYWQAYFEVLAGECGARGVGNVKTAKPLWSYRLNAEVLKRKISLADYIGRYTELKASGNIRLVGLCPIHRERHPSLFVYIGKDAPDWYCYGCSRGGDLISFVEAFNNCSFYEALEILNSELVKA